MPTETPLPCPYPKCGSAVLVDEVSPRQYQVECPYCDAMGPCCDTEAEAVAAWNRVMGREGMRVEWSGRMQNGRNVVMLMAGSVALDVLAIDTNGVQMSLFPGLDAITQAARALPLLDREAWRARCPHRWQGPGDGGETWRCTHCGEVL